MKPGFSEVAGEEFAPPDLIELETGLREAILNLESLVEQAQCVLEPVSKVLESLESVVILSLAADSMRGAAMWTRQARIQHAPREERYPSDVTDAEWSIISPMIPPPRRGGRHRETDMREVMNAVRYVLRTGCQWRQLPKDFPPRSTVYNYFWQWTRYGVLDRIHHMLLMQVRE